VNHNIRGSSARSIAASIEQAVHGGTLAAGQPLPTIRDLARSLRVSPVTVAAAYRQLQARGLVSGDRRRGSRIRPNPPSPLNPAPVAGVPEGLVDLATGNPDPALLPALDGPLRALDPSPRLYGEGLELRALVSFAAGEFAADGIPAAHLAVTSGALDAIERILREHLRAGDRVAVEDPTLPAILDLLAASGYRAEPVPLDQAGCAPASLAAVLPDVRAVILTPRAQNPTGAAWDAARADDLRRVLRKHRDSLVVIENDATGPVSGVPSATVSDGMARWAVVRSVSKFLGPDLRVALMAGDDLTIARVRGRLALGARWVSHLLQQLVLTLWSDPASARRLARAADLYTQRRLSLAAALASHGVTIDASSGFNVWIPVREETATVQALAQRGWAVAAGERFRQRAAPAIRVTTSALAVEEAPRLAEDVAACLRPSASVPA
jgi:DNA-binding transcriptional MocR family regulator